MSMFISPRGVHRYRATHAALSIPVISSLSGTPRVEDLGAFTLTVTGTGFRPDSVVQWDGSARTTTYVSSTSLTAAILAGDVDDAGTFAVTVYSPGVGISNSSTFTVTAGASGVAWDAATHGADITLSNSNYTATRGAAAANWRSVRGASGKSSGKWYWELLIDTSPTAGGHMMLGCATSSQSQTGYPGDASHGRGYQARPGSTPLVYASGASGAPNIDNDNYDTGSVVGFALDMDAATFSVYIANILQQTWSSLPAGTWYPCAGLYSSTKQVTLQASLTYSPPSGYSQLT